MCRWRAAFVSMRHCVSVSDSRQPELNPHIAVMPKANWTLGIVTLALFVGLGVYLAPLNPDIVTLQFTFSPVTFQAVLDAWGPEGVARYRAHLPVDGVLLLCYGALGYGLSTATALFTPFSPAARRFLAAVLPLAACCDSVENLLHWTLTAANGPGPAGLYAVAGISSTLKWLGIILFLLAALVALLRRKL